MFTGLALLLASAILALYNVIVSPFVALDLAAAPFAFIAGLSAGLGG